MPNMRRIPQPQATNAPAPAVAADGRAALLDPKLEPYADFAFSVGPAFASSYLSHDLMYDEADHEYRASYVRPGPFSLFLDAQLGLVHARSVAGNRAPLPARVPIAAAALSPETAHRAGQDELAMLMRRIRTDQAGGGADNVGLDARNPRLQPPKELLAYDWVVAHTGTNWVKHVIVETPSRDDTFQSLRLDGPGAYAIRMRVFFTRNRYVERNVTFTVTPKLLVGMGDSFASGEGNPDREAVLSDAGRLLASEKLTTLRQAIDRSLPTERDADWLEERAHRSLSSAQALAASMLQQRYGETWKPAGGPRQAHFDFTPVKWISFARSGGKIVAGLLQPQEGPGDYVGVGQVAECKRTLDRGQCIDALHISIGGNDAGFAGALSDLTQGQSFWSLLIGPFAPDLRAETLRALNEALGVGLPGGQEGSIGISFNALKAALDDLNSSVPIGKVSLTGYPDDMFFVRGPRGRTRFSACGVFETRTGLLSIDREEGELIRNAARTLNALIEAKCRQFGWEFVSVAADFAGKGYCEGSMWISADETAQIQADQRGTMHPSRLGHYAMAKRIHDAMMAAGV